MALYWRSLGILPLAAALAAGPAEPLEAADGGSRPVFSAGFSGTNTDYGWLWKLDASAGYRFGRHFEVTAGVPVYFVRAPGDAPEAGVETKTGLGNVYVDLRVMAESPAWYWSSSLRGAAPTGDQDGGFSSGRVSLDWNNYLEYTRGAWTPFGSVGVANSISDTHFVTQPFTSLGIVGQFEGGLLYHPGWWIGLGGSGYAVVPAGEQKIYSRIYAAPSDSGGGATEGSVAAGMALAGAGTPGPSGGSTAAGPGSGSSGISDGAQQRRSAFEQTFYTVSEADMARDHGFSAWVDVYPLADMALELGYSRSVSYEYNTVFVSARFDLAGMMRRGRD